jgi:ureidoglycolate lyase
MPLAVETLSDEAFAPFGRVVDVPTREPDAVGDPWRWWASAAVLDHGERPCAVGYLEVEPGHATFDWAERHNESEEMVVPLGGELHVYVAAPEPEQFRVFRVRPGQAVILGKRVWHGAPLARLPTSAIVLLAERTGELDTDKVSFEEIAVEEKEA